MATYDREELRRRYESATALAVASCAFTTELIGGIPADNKGVEAFVRNQLRLDTDEEVRAAVARIRAQELDPAAAAGIDITPTEGEITEKQLTGVKVLRRSQGGPYIMSHMVKACLKAAASRLHIFEVKRGTKGDMAEAGEVVATGPSMAMGEHPFNIHLMAPEIRDLIVDAISGKGLTYTELTVAPAPTYFRTLHGRVTLPQGQRSIVTQCECVGPGTRFWFKFRYHPKKLTFDDIANIFAMAQTIGLGLAKAFECGKFEITNLDITEPKK